VDKGVLASRREPWYLVEHVLPPDLFLAFMGRERIRAVRNSVQAVGSNSMCGLYLKSKRLCRGLCGWLNSDEGQRSIAACARHYSGGLLKLEPREVLMIRIPEPGRLAEWSH
jgi:hypothetical protein